VDPLANPTGQNEPVGLRGRFEEDGVERVVERIDPTVGRLQRVVRLLEVSDGVWIVGGRRRGSAANGAQQQGGDHQQAAAKDGAHHVPRTKHTFTGSLPILSGHAAMVPTYTEGG
jgi:hypothetical protein